MNTTAHAHDNAAAAGSRERRADAGSIRLSQRDIDGLLLVGEHWGAPSDLLAIALRLEADRLPALTARWRRAGYAATGRLGPGPAWCWLTRAEQPQDLARLSVDDVLHRLVPSSSAASHRKNCCSDRYC